jgi:hypothetical protein
LKGQIYLYYPELVDAPNTAATLEHLIEAAIETWERLEEDLLNKLIDTMENRVQAVLKADGWYTKY